MSADPIAVTKTFLDHWNAQRVDAAIDMLSADVLYDNVPFPDITGRENVRQFHKDFGAGTAFTVDWEVVHIAAAGNVVLNERVDAFTHTSGVRISVPVMGTLTVENGEITVWRDYFDSADFAKQMEALQG